MNNLAILFGAIGALGGLGGIAAVIYIVPTYRKIQADAKKVGVESDILLSGKALEMYDRALAEALGAKAEAALALRGTQLCRDEVDSLRDHIDVLEGMMSRAGLVPPPVPPRLYQIGGTG